MRKTIIGMALPLICTLMGGVAHALPEMSESGAAAYESKLKDSPFGTRISNGHTALRKQDFRQAEASFTEAGRLDPRSPLPALGMAESARIRNQSVETQKWLQRALSIAPKSPEALTAWGRWHYAQKNYAEAERAWNNAIAADSRATSPLVDLGDLNFNIRHNVDKAAEYYRKALQINPRLGGAHYALGMALLAKNAPDKAITAFEESARLSPGNPLPKHGLGRAYQQKKDYRNALAAFDQALVISPDYYPARLAKGDIQMAQGNPQQAIAEFLTVSRAQPKLYEAQIKLGMAYQQKKQRAEAHAAYLAAMKLNPQAPLAYNNLAWLATEEADKPSDAALEWARKAVALAPRQAEFQDTLGWVHLKRGEAAQACTVLEKANMASGKNSAGIHYHLGAACAAAGRNQQALEAYGKALKLDPGFENAADAKAQISRLESAGRP